MRYFLQRTVRRFVGFVVVVAAALLTGLLLYLWYGGDPKELEGRIRESIGNADEFIETARERIPKPSELGPMLQERLESPGAPPVSEGGVTVFFAPCSENGRDGIDDHFISLLEGAGQSIFCSFFELRLARAAQVLIDKHKAGVKVGIVSDSDYEDRDAVRACIDAGIPVVFDERSAFMHNKFCVVDGKRVWTGSMNITGNGMFRNNNNSVLIESEELADNYVAEFLEMFESREFGVRSPRNTPHPKLKLGEVDLECYFAPEDKVQKKVIDEIESARERIEFMAFSFTAKPVAEAMAGRMKQGVQVCGLFEERNANSKYSRDDYLADRGAEIHFDTNKYTMHHKVIVIDGQTVITGSYNFSASAEEKNDENVLILRSPVIAEHYHAEFERLTRN